MDCKLQPFKVSISYKGKIYSADVVQEIKATLEFFTLTHEGKTIQVQSNRPYIKSLPNSKKKPGFKAVNTKVSHLAFYEALIALYISIFILWDTCLLLV